MIYISGAITGTDDYLERFAQVEDMLRSLGHVAINPARVNNQLPPETTYEGYMKMSLAMLDMCDTIFMMDGWTYSKGACFEQSFARISGKKIIYERTFNRGRNT